MPANVEIKARIPSVAALLPVATALGDDEHAQLIHQDDTFFSVPHGRLKLRVFGDGSAATSSPRSKKAMNEPSCRRKKKCVYGQYSPVLGT